MSLGKFSSASFVNAAGIASIAALAFVEVRRESDNVLASIFSDVAGASPLGNPFQADVEGQFGLYAAGIPLGYKVTVTAAGTARQLRNVPIGTAMYLDFEAFIGKTAICVPAREITPRSANGCAVLATSNGAANQPDIAYLAFDGVVKEFAGFIMKMPKRWNEGTVTAAFDWRRASGTGAANVVWGIRALAVSDNDTPVANFGADATIVSAAKTTLANFVLSAETAACTIGGAPAEGDLVFFEVFRDGAAGTDTLDTVDAWLTSVTIFITTNAGNDA